MRCHSFSVITFSYHDCCFLAYPLTRTTDTEWRHKSWISEMCGQTNMLWLQSATKNFGYGCNSWLCSVESQTVELSGIHHTIFESSGSHYCDKSVCCIFKDSFHGSVQNKVEQSWLPFFLTMITKKKDSPGLQSITM